MPPSHAIVATKLDAIQAEMKRIGMWQAEPLTLPQPDPSQESAIEKFAWEQWLQYVFIPRARGIIATRGQFPERSVVAAQAFREWKMWGNREDVDALLQLLNDFDALFA